MRLCIDFLSVYIIVDCIVDRSSYIVAFPYRLQCKDASLFVLIPAGAVCQIMKGIRREMRHLPGRIDCVFFHVPQSSIAIDCDDLPVVKFKFSAQVSRDQGRNRHILIIYRIVTIGTA